MEYQCANREKDRERRRKEREREEGRGEEKRKERGDSRERKKIQVFSPKYLSGSRPESLSKPHMTK